jgi:hypothetical protein
LYSTRSPLVLRCTLLCSAILRCTPLVLHCTPLVLRLYSTRTSEYWSLAFSPLNISEVYLTIPRCTLSFPPNFTL